jgi:hypothetical protein
MSGRLSICPIARGSEEKILRHLEKLGSLDYHHHKQQGRLIHQRNHGGDLEPRVSAQCKVGNHI